MIMAAQVPVPQNMPNQQAQLLPLRDIKLPAEPGFWPLAPGWWVLIVVILLVLSWLAIKWYRYHLKKRRWLQINQQLSELEFAYQQNHDQQKLLTQVSVFLRRFVKFQLQQNQATALTGDSWLAYLNQCDPAQPFANYEYALTTGVYQAECAYDVAGLIETTREFMRKQVMQPTKSAQLNASVTTAAVEQPHV